MKNSVFPLAALLALAACGPSVEDQMENAVREGLAGQGTVKQVELTRESDDRLTGFAVVELREPPGTEARFSCSAERQSSSSDQYNWTCSPDANAGAGAGNGTAAPASDGKDPEAGAGAGSGGAAGPGRAALVGRWTDTGDCGTVTLLGEDGIFIAPNGARGNWQIEGDRLTISGAGGSVSWTVYFDDPNTMTLISDDGSRAQSTRC